jgi:nitrogen fixation-related uncharacterized protein
MNLVAKEYLKRFIFLVPGLISLAVIFFERLTSPFGYLSKAYYGNYYNSNQLVGVKVIAISDQKLEPIVFGLYILLVASVMICFLYRFFFFYCMNAEEIKDLKVNQISILLSIFTFAPVLFFLIFTFLIDSGSGFGALGVLAYGAFISAIFFVVSLIYYVIKSKAIFGIKQALLKLGAYILFLILFLIPFFIFVDFF